MTTVLQILGAVALWAVVGYVMFILSYVVLAKTARTADWVSPIILPLYGAAAYVAISLIVTIVYLAVT